MVPARAFLFTFLLVVLAILDGKRAFGASGGGGGGRGGEHGGGEGRGGQGGDGKTGAGAFPYDDPSHPSVQDPHNHGVRYFPPTLVPSPGDPQCLTTNTEQCSTLSSDTNFHPPLRCCQGSSSQCQDPITPSDFCSPSKGFQNGSKFCCLQYQAYSDALQAQGPHMITLVLLLLILQRILNGAPGA